MSYTYNTHGTCSRQITFDLDEEGKVRNVKFLGGCNGKGTSCPDQLAKAIDEVL